MYRKIRPPRKHVQLLPKVLLILPAALTLTCLLRMHVPSSASLSAQIIRSCAQIASPAQEILTFPALSESKWAVLDEKDRLDILQQIADAEMDAFGVIPAYVSSGELNSNNEHYAASVYRTADHQIVIDRRTLLGDYRFCVESLLHECRHAYQYSVIAMLDWGSEAVEHHAFFEEARRWKSELSQEAASYEAYYLQSIECDARSYVAQRLGLYCPDEDA